MQITGTTTDGITVTVEVFKSSIYAAMIWKKKGLRISTNLYFVLLNKSMNQKLEGLLSNRHLECGSGMLCLSYDISIEM